MESGFLTFILVSSFAVYSSHVGVTDWDDVLVAREGMPTTLFCTDTTVRGDVAINWKVQSLGADEWKLVLSANERKEFSGGASKASMRLIDPNFQDTGVFSLFFLPSMEDSGLYSCLVKQQERKLKERIILLAILTVTVVPPGPILKHSTLRLIASVTPDFAATKITWAAPGGISLKSERKPKTGTVAKLPQVQIADNGAYTCMVHPQGNSSSSLFNFNVDVTIDDDNVASFPNVTDGLLISTATQAQTSFTLTCPVVPGDYVRLYWQPPDNKKNNNMKLVYHYDRWRGSTLLTEQSKRLQLSGPPYNAEAGSFSFLLTPGLKDGGLYICNVYLNENSFSQSTQLSVLKVKTSHSSSKLELGCLYSERSQVQSANWKYQNKSRQLKLLSNGPGSISTILPIPITSDTAGNYTCTLQLKNGQTVWATQTVTLPHEESVSVTTPSLLPSLSALLLLVPLVAAAVCVLLWRQKHISERGIEQSLSVQSGEAENIYENPEDYRQAPPEGSVYMDLKPRGEDDVYKELERSEQCQS
ncbi:g6f-like [Morone saxatilis]|uniref:g6f-like n=1 Tax=Morone saxatilis TaxID=34816 RepID=UPI0015E1DAF7|nr:g6f-like [Morone saxatilis]